MVRASSLGGGTDYPKAEQLWAQRSFSGWKRSSACPFETSYRATMRSSCRTRRSQPGNGETREKLVPRARSGHHVGLPCDLRSEDSWSLGQVVSFTMQKDAEQIHGEVERDAKIICYWKDQSDLRWTSRGICDSASDYILLIFSQTRRMSSPSTNDDEQYFWSLRQVVLSLCKRTHDRSMARSSATPGSFAT